MVKILQILILFFIFGIGKAQNVSNSDFKYVCSNQELIGQSPTMTSFSNLMTNCGGAWGGFNTLTPKVDLYLVRIKSGSTFTFLIEPTANIDYDFASWLNPNLTDLGYSDRSSQNDPNQSGIFSIGLELNRSNLCEEGGSSGPGKVKHYDVVEGDVILIAVDRWEDYNAGYRISFGGNAELDCTFTGHEFTNCTPTGESVFDLGPIKQSILSNYSAGYTGKFYLNQQDAITNSSNEYISNTYNLNQESALIYLQIRNAMNIFEKIERISLRNIQQLEFVPNNIDYCENIALNGVNLLDALPQVVRSNTNFTNKFYRNETDALNDQNRITNVTNFRENYSVIYIRTENVNATNCYSIQNFELINQPVNLIELLPFEICATTAQNQFLDLSAIATNYPALTGYALSYFENELDLRNNQNQIINANAWSPIGKIQFYVRAMRNGECPQYYKIPLKTHVEDFSFLSSSYDKCPSEDYVLDLSHVSYELNLFGDFIQLAMNKFLLHSPGNYSISYTSENGCLFTKEFTVIDNSLPMINRINFVNNQVYLEVNYSGNLPIYYSLDQINWQLENYFTLTDYTKEYHFYAKVGNCETFLDSFKKEFIPTFFSPNRDGINDIWKVYLGKDKDYEVKIFDRFGKLLIEWVSPNTIEWDGQLNGKKMPSTSYWYTIKVKTNPTGNFKTYSGTLLLKSK